MGKSKVKAGGGSSSKRGNDSGGSSAWGADKHSSRVDARLASLQKKCNKKGKHISEALSSGYKRSNFAHDSRDKIDDSRVRLNITLCKKELEKLRKNLTEWDEVEEKMKRKKKEEEDMRKRKLEEDEMNGIKKKKRGRLGPETWKLRGAARPASEVYDFDTRYVCPHIQEHERAKERSQRLRNILSTHRGEFASSTAPQPQCRTFLSLLMQLGTLSVEAKRLRSAREAFLECMELEGDDYENGGVITNARCRLMNMYLDSNRPESARRLYERIPHDPSAWVQFGGALVEFISWKVLGEEGSSRVTAEQAMANAIRANVYCAFHLAYFETFEGVVEYADDIEDADMGTLEEAIEYCSSNQMGAWLGTEGALDFVRFVLQNMKHQTPTEANSDIISVAEYDWETKLTKAEQDFRTEEKTRLLESQETDEMEEQDNDNDEGYSETDFLMYAGMFRTAMEMLEDNGEFDKKIEFDFSDSQTKEEDCDNAEEKKE